MHTKTLVTTLILAVALAAGGAALAGSDAKAPGSDNPPALSAARILDKLEAAGYRDVDEIERKARHFEVEATDPDGRRGEFYVDPANGEVFEAKLESDRRARHSKRDRNDGRAVAAAAGVI